MAGASASAAWRVIPPGLCVAQALPCRFPEVTASGGQCSAAAQELGVLHTVHTLVLVTTCSILLLVATVRLVATARAAFLFGNPASSLAVAPLYSIADGGSPEKKRSSARSRSSNSSTSSPTNQRGTASNGNSDPSSSSTSTTPTHSVLRGTNYRGAPAHPNRPPTLGEQQRSQKVTAGSGRSAEDERSARSVFAVRIESPAHQSQQVHTPNRLDRIMSGRVATPHGSRGCKQCCSGPLSRLACCCSSRKAPAPTRPFHSPRSHPHQSHRRRRYTSVGCSQLCKHALCCELPCYLRCVACPLLPSSLTPLTHQPLCPAILQLWLRTGAAGTLRAAGAWTWPQLLAAHFPTACMVASLASAPPCASLPVCGHSVWHWRRRIR